MSSNITKFTLPNGLLVLLKEIHTTPLISQWMWYRVGSRNETPGMTGAAHWVEHMLFSGTNNFPAAELEASIAREGGYWNAMTFKDWTAYLATMPKDKIDLLLQLEADRMKNIQFNDEKVNAERGIIISEREGLENDPSFLLNDEVTIRAFQTHPYRNETIGLMQDLKTLTSDQLRNFYRTHYQPQNAVLALAGDFDANQLKERITELYSNIQSEPNPIAPIALDSPHTSEQIIELEGPEETTFIQVSYRAPSATNPDFFPFMVMDSLLSGASSLNMFGGSISNKTSRLFQHLVESSITVGVEGGIVATIDPYLYNIHLTLNPDQSIEKALSALESQIQRIRDKLPAQAEIDRAVKQARALFAYGSESITNQAFWLGFSEMFDTYDWFTNYIANLEQVTPKDIEEIANKYLTPNNRIVGIYKPQAAATLEEGKND